jgi:hypothetical protein
LSLCQSCCLSVGNRLSFELSKEGLCVLYQELALFIGEFPSTASAVLSLTQSGRAAIALREAGRAQHHQLPIFLDYVNGSIDRVATSGLLTPYPIFSVNGNDCAQSSIA